MTPPMTCWTRPSQADPIQADSENPADIQAAKDQELALETKGQITLGTVCQQVYGHFRPAEDHRRGL